ncbi:TPA: hypothetical protein ACOECQ_000596 [Stenotrophomonas maltophilia]|uniref:hypothetical protein n=1 Tax=Stenotrophomonas maltophilia TaxID=40324 RepID=UPI001E6036CF|nr:hypothetical protein [Stenotrophomonas maltophilia]
MTEKLVTLPANCPVLRDAFETISAIAVEAVWLPNQAKAITLAQAQTALRELHHRLPRLQDLRVFEAAVTAYVSTLRSSMQDGDTPLCDTTRARLAQATELLELVRNQTHTAVDPADPWRGLYHPSHLPARNADGEILCHPDVPAWADGREVSLRPLFLAQGFDLVVVEGEFSEEGMGSGVYSTAQELHDWNPEAPGGDWRLAWLGETEDGLAAWFVRPLAIAAMNRPTAASTLADVQPGGRVRLGDQAERARFEAWAGENYHLQRMGDVYRSAITTDAWQAWTAALSAQPSPGGQGGLNYERMFVDACAALAEVSRELGCDPEQGGAEPILAAIAELREALAARQPVYEGHTWVSDYVLAGLRERAEMPLQLRNGEVWHWQGDGHDFPESLVCPVVMSAETLRALLAARQPVGEAVAWMTHHDEPMLFPTAAEAAAYSEDDEQPVPLFRSPAQAVDLGEIIEQIAQQWDGCSYDAVGETIDVGQAIRAAGKRLIDSQAVGNG